MLCKNCNKAELDEHRWCPRCIHKTPEWYNTRGPRIGFAILYFVVTVYPFMLFNAWVSSIKVVQDAPIVFAIPMAFVWLFYIIAGFAIGDPNS